MNLKHKILNTLSNKKLFVPGEELASIYGVSRSAVWKVVTELRAEGHEIESDKKLGYRLLGGPDVLNPAEIVDSLRSCRFAGDCTEDHIFVELPGEVDSTNEYLKRRAGEGAPELTIAIAERQTGGKGRNGKSFFSPPHSGLYLSLLLRPRFDARRALFLTAAASVAAARAVDYVRETTLGVDAVSLAKAEIKWVNDVFLNGKKICGILTEGTVDLENNGLSYAVLGAGFNLWPPAAGIPVDLLPVFGTIFEKQPNNPVRNKLVSKFVESFAEYYFRPGFFSFAEEYRQRSLVLRKRVSFNATHGPLSGIAVRIDDECRLIVCADDGAEHCLEYGDVSLTDIENILRK